MSWFFEDDYDYYDWHYDDYAVEVKQVAQAARREGHTDVDELDPSDFVAVADWLCLKVSPK